MAISDFYIQPADFSKGQGLIGVGAMSLATSMKEKAEQQKQQFLLDEATRLFNEGTPEEVSAFAIKHPEIGKRITSEIDRNSKLGAERMKKDYAELITNPANADQIFSKRLQDIYEAGGDYSETLTHYQEYQKNPEAYLKGVESNYALLDPTGYKAWKEALTGVGKPDTANIKDWNHYQSLLKTDPAAAEMFARQVGITETAETALKPTTAMQNYEKWSSMEEGPEKKAFARLIGIDPKLSPEAQIKHIERIEGLSREVESSDAVITMANDLLGNSEYLEAISGLRGATPFSVPGGTGYDAMVAFEQLKDNLTLENLNKMSGVLTDRDIQILASAGSGLKAGMSRSAMEEQLKKIRNVLMVKTERQRGKLEGMGYNRETGQVQSGPVNWSDL